MTWQRLKALRGEGSDDGGTGDVEVATPVTAVSRDEMYRIGMRCIAERYEGTRT